MAIFSDQRCGVRCDVCGFEDVQYEEPIFGAAYVPSLPRWWLEFADGPKTALCPACAPPVRKAIRAEMARLRELHADDKAT